MFIHRGYKINCGVDIKTIRNRQPEYLGAIRDMKGNVVKIPESHGFDYIRAQSKKECIKRCMNYIDRNLC